MRCAEEILNITEPGGLFSNSIEDMKFEYKSLAKQWHPDINGNSSISQKVMVKINELYYENQKLIKAGQWRKPGFVQLLGANGKKYEINYRISYDFELGKTYIGSTVVLFLLDSDHQELYDNGINRISNFSFADQAMKNEVEQYLPQIVSHFKTKDDKLALVVKKSRDLFLLHDILSYYDGKIPSPHVSWILSSLCNLSCYIDYVGLSHNAISIDTYFISPRRHSGALLGGWWYSVPQERKMLGVSEKIYSIMPPCIRNSKCGSIQTDLESIRLIGRELLGDRTGTKFLETEDVPTPLTHWLKGVSSQTALDDYCKWQTVLDQSYGKRKFVNMSIPNEYAFYSKIKNKKEI